MGELQEKLESEAAEKVKMLQEKVAAAEKANTLEVMLDNLRKETEKVCEEKNRMALVIGRNNDERAKILSEKTDLLLIAIKHNKLMRDARERLECPVCLVVRVHHENTFSKKLIVHTPTTSYGAYINHTQKLFFQGQV